MQDRDIVKQLIVEFVGPFTLCFAGISAIMATGGSDIVAIALAHGLAIGLMITAAGHISGGHFNPAVTLGFLAARRIEPVQAGLYIVAQLVGGFFGALVARICFPSGVWDELSGGIPAIGADFNAGQALTMEIVTTFFLVFIIFGAAVDGRTGRVVAGLAIGLTISMGIMAGGAVSGAALNPARALGPQLLEGSLGDSWIYILGPIVGGVAAALLYNEILFPGVSGTTAAAPDPAEEFATDD